MLEANTSPSFDLSDRDLGVSARTVQELFLKFEKLPYDERKKYTFFVSMYQIYNDQIFDLLNFSTDKGGQYNQDKRRTKKP